MGKRFLIAIPNPSKLISTKGVISVMTFEAEATVNIQIPNDMYHPDTAYFEKIFEIARSISADTAINSDDMVHENKLGMAIKIIANKEVSVIISVANTETKHSEMIYLPPCTSYQTSFRINVPSMPSFLLTLAMHQNTLVYYHFKSDQLSNIFSCGWNCTTTNRQSALVVLNASTFAYFSADSDFQQSTIYSSRPILVVWGDCRTNSFSVISGLQQFSKRFVALRPMYPTYELPETLIYRILGLVKPYTVTFYESQIKTIRSGDKYVMHHNVSKGEDNFIIVTASRPVSMICYFTNTKYDFFAINIVPPRFWPSYTLFKLPTIFFPNDEFVIYLIAFGESVDSLLFNDKTIELSWIPMKDYDRYPYKYIKFVIKDPYIKLMQTDPRDTFMAYVTLLREKYPPRYNVGLSLGQINIFPLTNTEFICYKNRQKKFGDSIDNDCDGRIDEEVQNGEDDDFDSLVDEDVMEDRVSGSWGPWQPWYCHKVCGLPGQRQRLKRKRFRACDDPIPRNKGGVCRGLNVETAPGTCGTCSRVVFIDTCPLGKFLRDCTGDCPQGCYTNVCDQGSGKCSSCSTGYKQTCFCEILVYETPSHDVSTIITVNNTTGTNIEKTRSKPGSSSNSFPFIRLIPIPFIIMIVASLLMWIKSNTTKKQ